MKQIDRGILYLCMHKRFYDKTKSTNFIIERKEVVDLLGRLFLVPKSLRPLVIREMEQKNMVKKVGRTIKVLPLYCDPEENLNKFYKQLGLY